MDRSVFKFNPWFLPVAALALVRGYVGYGPWYCVGILACGAALGLAVAMVSGWRKRRTHTPG